MFLSELEVQNFKSLEANERVKALVRETLDDKGTSEFNDFINDIIDKIEDNQPLNKAEQEYVTTLLKIESCKKMQDAIFLERHKKGNMDKK